MAELVESGHWWWMKHFLNCERWTWQDCWPTWVLLHGVGGDQVDCVFNSLNIFAVKEIYQRRYSDPIGVVCLLISDWILPTIFLLLGEFVLQYWRWWWRHKMHWFGLALLAVLGVLYVWFGLVDMRKIVFLAMKASSLLESEIDWILQLWFISLLFVYQHLWFWNNLEILFCRNVHQWSLCLIFLVLEEFWHMELRLEQGLWNLGKYGVLILQFWCCSEEGLMFLHRVWWFTLNLDFREIEIWFGLQKCIRLVLDYSSCWNGATAGILGMTSKKIVLHSNFVCLFLIAGNIISNLLVFLSFLDRRTFFAQTSYWKNEKKDMNENIYMNWMNHLF